MADQNAIRKMIITFLVITFVLTGIFLSFPLAAGTMYIEGSMMVFFGVMWSPGIAAIVTCLIFQRNLRGLGWGWGKTRYQVLSYILPAAVALIAYSIVWLTGLGAFYQPEGFGAHNARMFGLGSNPPLALGIALKATFVFLISLIFALGEEIGWRGFFVPRLSKLTSFTGVGLISGVVWAVYHSPGILFLEYYNGVNRWTSLLCFTVMIVALSFIMAWIRLKSGSLWTAAIFHASHNVFIQGVFDQLTKDTGVTFYFTTEFGAGLAVVYSIVAIYLWTKRGKLQPQTA
ncbi:MAG TPA: type II CAAX endopeptidase family protein [Acidobacteriota bacterium]|nr:type II CAAX endopeptidase family protein [Acidobacteriota bacterium]